MITLPEFDVAPCKGKGHLFFAPQGERPETRHFREMLAGRLCRTCEHMTDCRRFAREHREYGYWGGESEEDRAAAGFAPDMPIGNVARLARGARQNGVVDDG